MSLKVYFLRHGKTTSRYRCRRFRDRIRMPVASVSVVEMAERGPLLHKIADRKKQGYKPLALDMGSI
ncbi:MAG: hypothetical protein F6J86_31705 [Symploca sp. SIO1B1]|nr:hypothetical protein [Symploca sp. SIO1B1]